MRMLCKLGWHKWSPQKVFHTQLMTASNSHYGWQHNFTGYSCQCGKRKLVRHDKWRHPAKGVYQEAYDWLNQRPQQSQVLRMVK